jgi:hypothetical protein
MRFYAGPDCLAFNHSFSRYLDSSRSPPSRLRIRSRILTVQGIRDDLERPKRHALLASIRYRWMRFNPASFCAAPSCGPSRKSNGLDFGVSHGGA